MEFDIEVEGLSFTYGSDAALRDVTLRLGRGEKVALVGLNGAGKTTLMLHLNGLLRGDGQIRVGGIALADDSLPQIRAAVGFVFQNPDDQLFSPTVFDDVAFGLTYQGVAPTEVTARVAEALAEVGLAGFEQRVSHHLSVGEKKRVALATVLSMRPAILVLDEPTAGLDPRGRRGLMDLLRRLPQTMLVSTHDLRLAAALFERTVVLCDGRVAADGPTAALFADAEFMRRHGLDD